MDYNMEDDIDVIVGDTNLQLELENKLLSDLMASLEYEPIQEKKETEAVNLSDCEFENTKFPNAVKSHGRDFSPFQRRIPVIIIETEDEWKRRQFNEKQAANYCDEKTSPGKITERNKQCSKQEDRDFEINMAHFQKELSEVIKDDMNARSKYKDDFSSILDELESQIAKETWYSKERNTKDGEEEFGCVMRATKRGQYCCVTSGHPITSNKSECLLDVSRKTSVYNEELEIDSASTLMGNSLRDSLMSNESERSELMQVAMGSSHQTFDNPAVRLLDNLPKGESLCRDEDINYSSKLFDKPCFIETESAIIDSLGQSAEISFGMPCKAKKGGHLQELPQLPGCIVESNKLPFHEQALDDVDILNESSGGILSRNGVANQESSDNVPERFGSNLEKIIDLPIIIGNISDEKKETDLAYDERKLAAGLEYDNWNKIMSRNHESCAGNEGDLRIAYNLSRANCKENISEPFAVKDIVDNNENKWDRGKDGVESSGIVTMEKPDNLTSFEDNMGVVVTSPDVLQTTIIGDMEKYGKELAKLSKTGCIKNLSIRSNEAQGNFHMDMAMDILSEEKKIKVILQVDGMDFWETKNKLRLEKEKDGLDNDTNFGPYSVQEFGTLVDISPCSKEGPEYLGPKPERMAGAIYNVCDERVLSHTQTCGNMSANEMRKSTNTSRVCNAEYEKDTKHNLELSVKENETVISCEEVYERSRGYCEYFNGNSGYESHYKSHDIQALIDETKIYPKHEASETAETNIEPTFCGSMKRQREQSAAELEVGLKKIKFGDSSEQGQKIPWDEWKPLNNASDYRRQQKIQAIENTCEKEEYDHTVVKRECCDRVKQLDIRENKDIQITGDKESNLFPLQKPEAEKQNRKNVPINSEEVWDLDFEVGTFKNAKESASTLVAEQEFVPVVLGLKSFERLDNMDVLDNEHAVFDKDGKEALNLELTRQEMQVTENCFVARGFAQASAINKDGGAVVSSEHVNELLMEEKVAEESLHEKTFLQTTAESIRREEGTQILNPEEVTQRVTQDTEQKSERNPKGIEIRWQLKDNGTQQHEERVTQDVMDKKLTQDTEREEQTWRKKLKIEHNMEEDLARNATEDATEKNTKRPEGNAKREDQKLIPEFLHAKRSPDIYEELAKRLVKKVLQENDFEEDQNIKQEQGEGAMLSVTHRVTLDKDHLDGVTQQFKITKQKAASVKAIAQVRAQEGEPRITQDTTHVKTPKYEDVKQDLEKAETTRGICLEVQEGVTRKAKLAQASTIETAVTQPEEQEMAQSIKQQEKNEKGDEVVSHMERFVMHREKEKVLFDRKQKVTQGQKIIEQVGEVTHIEEVTQQFGEEVTHESKDGIKEIGIEVNKKGENGETEDLEEDDKKRIANKLEKHLESGVTEKDVTGGDLIEGTDGVVTQPQTEKQRKIEGVQPSEEKALKEKGEGDILCGTNVKSMEERGNTLRKQDGIVNHFLKNEELKDLEKKMQHLQINSNSRENWIEGTEAKSKITKEELKLYETEELKLKSSKTQRKNENEMTSFQELEKEEDRENRIRSFEMLIHLETIIKEIEIYRYGQNRLRESFKMCMNEITSNLSSMRKALQLVETRLNHKISFAHEKLKAFGAENDKGKETTKISMDALLKSCHMMRTQFEGLRQRLKELESICAALNITEMQRTISNQFSAEIDTMDKKVKFTENDISDLKLRVLELERECSSLRKLAPNSKAQLEIEVEKGEVRIDRTATSFYNYNMMLDKERAESALGRMRENENDDLSLVQNSPSIGSVQRYYGLHSEEV